VLALAAGLSGAPANAQKVVFEQQGGGVVRRVLVVPPAELNLRRAVELSRRFLADNQGRYRLQLLYIGGDAGEAVRYSAGKSPLHIDYEYWRILFHRYGRSSTPLAEMLAMPGGATLRWHDPRSGQVDRVLLAGRDPLRLRLGAVEFEILHVAPVPLPEHEQVPGGEACRVHIHLRTQQRFKKSDVRRAMLFLRNRLRLTEITVQVRNETWFLVDYLFPVVYRFDRSFRAPSEKEWLAAPEGYCASSKKEIVCAGQY
jgi:hypothetical protein